ncbi:hypothetical protein BX600DRAFT_39022 [Xylariales sp. PMI_506]|nr:hypothetical protein BX600DRAFT_39022 [Xylariales sp. PMI_506]
MGGLVGKHQISSREQERVREPSLDQLWPETKPLGSGVCRWAVCRPLETRPSVSKTTHSFPYSLSCAWPAYSSLPPVPIWLHPGWPAAPASAGRAAPGSTQRDYFLFGRPFFCSTSSSQVSARHELDWDVLSLLLLRLVLGIAYYKTKTNAPP